MSSTVATWNNMAVSRKFPGLEWELSPDVPQDVFLRVTCYRLVARLFYIQALFFWAVLVVLVCAKVAGID
ncbi:MAG TPA: hypothetical protein VFB13_19740 [Reyranella sp.]|nr:hypothetical protein [Reyranella sp.]